MTSTETTIIGTVVVGYLPTETTQKTCRKLSCLLYYNVLRHIILCLTVQNSKASIYCSFSYRMYACSLLPAPSVSTWMPTTRRQEERSPTPAFLSFPLAFAVATFLMEQIPMMVTLLPGTTRSHRYLRQKAHTKMDSFPRKRFFFHKYIYFSFALVGNMQT